ncbi:MAG: ABC transporter substrate-binding protein [Azonexus sp.]|nr:ABC transporter substrate-binding protein [Azonexus sp.]
MSTLSFFRKFWIAASCSALMIQVSLAETGVSDREILIGQSIALQGGKNAYGLAAAEGVRLYVDAANAAGGINGRKIVLRVLDDDNNSTKAEANARQLVADGVFILFGSIEGGPSNGVMKVAGELKVPFFGPMAGSPTMRRPYQPYVFPVRAEHRDEFRALIQWGKTTGLKSVGFLHSDSEVGLSHLENVKAISAELGMQLAVAIPFKGDAKDGEIDTMLKLLADKKPDMLFNHGSSDFYLKFIQKARAAGLKTNFMGVNSGSTQIAGALGPMAAGMVFSQVVPSPAERKHLISREYQDALLKANSKQEYSYGALEGYMTAKALVKGLRAAGGDLTRAGLIRSLESSRYDLGGVGVRYVPGDHEGSRFVDLSIVSRDGRFIH